MHMTADDIDAKVREAAHRIRTGETALGHELRDLAAAVKRATTEEIADVVRAVQLRALKRNSPFAGGGWSACDEILTAILPVPSHEGAEPETGPYFKRVFNAETGDTTWELVPVPEPPAGGAE
jgi:hypothetical protein